MSGRPDSRPPLRLRFLSRILPRDSGYGLIGDIHEMFRHQLESRGRIRAEFWLWGQTGRALGHALANFIYWNLFLFSQNMKITFRRFRRHKLYSAINITGLGVGMACCILILSYVRAELRFDRFHARGDRIHRLVVNGTLSNRPFDLACTNGAQAPGVARAIPEIENFVRFAPLNRTAVRYRDRRFFESGILWADASVFEVFSFPLIQGSPENALAPAFCAVLTESAAERYFGEDDPIGRILTVNDEDSYTITGVMADVPDDSHLQFDILFSFKTYEDRHPMDFARWMGNFGFYSYLLLHEGADPKQVEAKFVPLVEQHIGPVLNIVGGEIIFRLQPIESIHLHSHLLGEISSNPDPAYIAIFSAVALFILALAVINFMNLATARSAGRGREVGIRKVHGADRKRLISRFLEESVIHSFMALGLALILVEITLPAYRIASGRDLGIPYLTTPWLIPALIGLALAVGIAAGSYPAFILAAFQPVTALRGKTGGDGGNKRFRSLLVTFQFTLSIALLIGTGIIFRQLHFMKNKPLGFDKRHVVVLRLNNPAARQAAPNLRREFLSLPFVEKVGAASHVPGWGASHNAVLPEGFRTEDSLMMGIIRADQDYLETIGVKIASGRSFSRDFPSDPGRAAVINRTAARQFGWDNPLGKQMRELDGISGARTVVGVTEDHHFMDVRTEIEPLVIFCNPGNFSTLSVRLTPGRLQDQIKALREKWESVVPGAAYDGFFLDRSFDSQYRSEERLGRLFSIFTGLAVFIGCLGIFGMAASAAERRTREIGIRRVLGASSFGLILLLSRDMLRPILIANLLAWPAAFWASGWWLRDFAYRSRIDPLIFIGSALGILLIGFLTTVGQSLQAVRMDPVHSLKHE